MNVRVKMPDVKVPVRKSWRSVVPKENAAMAQACFVCEWFMCAHLWTDNVLPHRTLS